MRDEHAELLNTVADLVESLDLPHKAKAVQPLINRLARGVRRAFRTNSRDNLNTVLTIVQKRAFVQGAKQAQSDLGPVAKVKEASQDLPDHCFVNRGVQEARKPYPLPLLPDPARTAALALSDVDWTDADHSSERALMIAEYEVSRAYHDGMASFAHLWRGGNGPVEKRAVAQDDACEEVCVPNAEMDYIDEESPFDSGDMEPPFHPRCRCSIEYRQTPE